MELQSDNNPFAIYSNPKTDLFFGVRNVRDRGDQESLLQFNNIQNGLRAGYYVLGKQYDGLTVDEIGQKYSRTDNPSLKFEIIGVSIISPDGLAISPRIPANCFI